jgi:hypothetical protein
MCIALWALPQSRNQPPLRLLLQRIIFRAELRARQRLLGRNPSDDRRDQQRGDQHADDRVESERPAERVEDHPGTAPSPDDAAGDECMAWLDRDETAEAVA